MGRTPINTTGNARAALALQLRVTADGEQFRFMVNHLYRSRDDERHKQVTLLNVWAARQTLPVIAVGDYNFDWDIAGSGHDAGYDLLTATDQFRWVQPATLVTTQCSGWPCTFNHPTGPIANRNANLRSGPGASYAVAGSTQQVQALRITGRNAAGDWYQLASGAWIAAFLVDSAPAGLPVVAAPVVPTTVPAAPTVTPVPAPSTATPVPSQPVAPSGTANVGTAVVNLGG